MIANIILDEKKIYIWYIFIRVNFYLQSGIQIRS